MPWLTYWQEKDEILRQTRNISFEDAIDAIEGGRILDIEENPNYPHQRRFILDIHGYPYVCPFVEDEHEVFLKTLYPDGWYKHLIH